MHELEEYPDITFSNSKVWNFRIYGATPLGSSRYYVVRPYFIEESSRLLTDDEIIEQLGNIWGPMCIKTVRELECLRANYGY